MQSYDKFHHYLSELCETYTRLAVLLTQKLDAIEGFHIEVLDDIIKQEQVYVMISRGFDANIENFRSALLFKGDKLSDIIDEMPVEHTQAFRTLFEKLKLKLEECQQLNDLCQNLANERLYSLQKAINELDSSTAPTYKNPSSDNKPNPNNQPHIFTKSI